VSAVFGTPLRELPKDDRPALLISDLHVPADGGEVVPMLDAALAAAIAQRARLFVLGDLFDSYVCRAQVRVGVWRSVAERFAAAVAADTEIHVLRGNRDFLLGEEFVAASRVQLAAGGLRVTLAGVDTVLLHGDELCRNDLPYQKAKRWLRHPLTRWLARHLPLRVALRVAERARERSKRVIQRGDQQRFLPTQAALATVFATGAHQVVFGHIHRHAAGAVAGGRYWVLPAFDAGGTGLFADAEGLRAVGFSAPDGAMSPVPDPGECTFPR
jgi:UDP-2,3-diacylglucosamine hydrolase